MRHPPSGIRLAPIRHLIAPRYLHITRPRPQHHQHLLDELRERGLLQSITSRSLRAHLSPSPPSLDTDGAEATQVKRTVYAGVDPSARSLHVGNLLPLMALLHFAKYGHRSLALIGGATGSIGDPSGRSTERSALDKAELEDNVASISQQLRQFFERAQEYTEQRQDPIAAASDTYSKVEAAAQSASGGKKAEDAAERAFSSGSDASFSASPSTSTTAAAAAAVAAEDSSLDSTLGDRLTSTPSLDVRLVNNLQWFSNLNVLDFLGTVGRHARIQTMISRDSVKNRLSAPVTEDGDAPTMKGEGLSFTEFSYQLLQAYDFSVLHSGKWGCSVQIGGSDQMGNIMAGVDLIRRMKAASSSSPSISTTSSRTQTATTPATTTSEEKHVLPAYGLTLPLLTTSSGAKFGKSAGNAIWLSPSLLSDFEFYQFFLRSRDDEVEKYLLALTLLPVPTIRDEVMVRHEEDRKKRIAQRTLAEEVTELVRGKEARKRAEMATRVMFETELEGVQVEEVVEAFRGTEVLVEWTERGQWVGEDVTKVAVKVGLVKSRADAKRALANGGLYLNNVPISKAGIKVLDDSDLLAGPTTSTVPPGGRQFAILRVGKTEHRVVVVPSS